MKKIILSALIAFFIIGCGTPKLVKYDTVFVVDNINKQIPRNERRTLSRIVYKLYEENLNRLAKERKIKKVKYKEWVYTEDGLKIDFSKYGSARVYYYGEYSSEKKAKAQKIINELENSIKVKISRLEEMMKKVDTALKNHPFETVKISSSVLNDEQKRFFIKKIVKNYYLGISQKYGYYYVTVFFRAYMFKYPFLHFSFSHSADIYDPNKVSITLNARIKYFPQYELVFSNIKFDVKAYEKGYYDTKLGYKIKLENTTDKFYKVKYLTFYYNDDVYTYSNEIVLSPFTKISKDYVTSASKYKMEITKENKNSLIYGLATEINQKSYSKIYHTTFDELFKKYVK